MIQRRHPLRRKTPLARSTKPLRRTRVRRISAKRRRENFIYFTLRGVFLGQNPQCQVRAGGCAGNSSEVHHRCGRGKNLNAVETWVAICRHCHDRTHLYPSWARENGWLK